MCRNGVVPDNAMTGIEQEGSVSDSQLNEMIATGSKLRRDVEKWLRQSHPEFV